MSTPTVYIVDDDPSARQGIMRLVKAAEYNVESYSSARDFLDSGNHEQPGCIILDVKMPGMTGPELQEELSEVDYSMPIIFLSGHGDVPTTANAMKNGAVDFLTKPVDRDELLWAIRVSLAKDAEDRTKRDENLSINEHIKSLTPREYEIMTYVITGMLNKQIAAELFISEETVKIHRGRLMHKLEIVSVAELVHLCETVGIAPAKSKSRKL